MLHHTGFFSVANDTKWFELRNIMLELDAPPKFRSKCITNSYVSNWDGEWFYHFLNGGFEDIEWFEVKGGQLFESKIFEQIVRIQFCGKVLDNSLRLYGFVENGQATEKLVMNS